MVHSQSCGILSGGRSTNAGFPMEVGIRNYVNITICIGSHLVAPVRYLNTECFTVVIVR